MASTSKAPCATCGSKGVGIFKCEGCAQVFCRKHVMEHRDFLSHQLDEVVLEYDTLQQTIVEYKEKQNKSDPLIKQIDKWERVSVEKIQQRAEEARQQVYNMTGSQDETVSKELHDLAERLQKARTDDDYVETDLRAWLTKLNELKRDVITVPPTISIREDPTEVLIANMYVSSTVEHLEQEECFGEFIGDICVEDNGCTAVYSGSGRTVSCVRGVREYSRGKHKIRFIVNKNNAGYVMSFNIVSKSLSLDESRLNDGCGIYGWYSDDDTNNPDKNCKVNKKFQDMRGKTVLKLQLLIDCDSRNISYFNERTKNTREMKVDINKCPLPWQLQFYLYDIGDRVILVSCTETS